MNWEGLERKDERPKKYRAIYFILSTNFKLGHEWGRWVVLAVGRKGGTELSAHDHRQHLGLGLGLGL